MKIKYRAAPKISPKSKKAAMRTILHFSKIGMAALFLW